MTDELVNGDSRAPNGDYSAVERERALHVLALCSGNTRRACRELEARGYSVPRSTLRDWRNKTHADRYQEICDQVLPAVYGRMAQENESLALDAIDIERRLIERIDETMDDLKPGDVSASLRNVSVTKGIATQQSRLLRGEPTQISETRHDLRGLVRALAQRHPAVVQVEGDDYIEGEAEEVPPLDPPDIAA